MTYPRRRLALAGALAVGIALGASSIAGAQNVGGSESAKVVNVVQVDGVIDSAYADYIVDELRAADRGQFAAVVLRLDSPGVVKASTARLVRAIESSRVPVTTWVGPNDASVRGGAADMWAAGAVRFVGPGATVVSPTGQLRGEQAVTAGAARATKATVAEVARSLEGIDGTTATIRFANPSLVRRVRHALVLPWLVHLLLLSGFAALVFELFQRGFGPSGYAGLVLLAFAAVGLAGLPSSPVMVALLTAGVAAMTLDVARGGLGFLTWGGAAALAVGSRFLVHGGTAASVVPWWSVVGGTIASTLFYVVVMTLVLRVLRAQPAELGAALVGRVAEVRSTLNPQGHVLVDGALWRARAVESDGPVATGVKVQVAAVDESELLLDVVPLGS